MDSSIRKRISDYLLARIKGEVAGPLPAELAGVKFNKNRSTAVGGDELPMISVYFVQDQPTPVGAQQKPVVLRKALMIEIRVIVHGTDDTADPYCVWVHQQVTGADRCIVDGQQLALGVVEAETPFVPLEGAQNEITIAKQRFYVDYKTNAVDLTRTA